MGVINLLEGGSDMAKYGIRWCESQAGASGGSWSDWIVGEVMFDL